MIFLPSKWQGGAAPDGISARLPGPGAHGIHIIYDNRRFKELIDGFAL
jgi:hypothetical protein